MIRSRSLRRIKIKTPGGSRVIHYVKRSKKALFRFSPKIKKELLKKKVRR